MEELKPCPFCGGKVVGFEWSDYGYWEEGEPHDEDAFCDVKVDHKKDCILKLGEFNLWAASTEEEAANYGIQDSMSMITIIMRQSNEQIF